MTQPEPGPPLPAWPPPATAAPAPAPDPAPRASGIARWWPLLLGALVVLSVVAYLVLWDRLTGGDGTGTFDVRVSADQVAARDVTVGADHAIVVSAEPDDDVDVVLALVVDEGDAERLADLYEELDLVEPVDPAEAFPAVPAEDLPFEDGEVVVLRADVGFAGEAETLVLPTPFELASTVVVAPFDAQDDGEARLTVDVLALDVGAEPDAEDLLEATAAADGVPGPAKDLVAEILEEG